MERNVGQVTIAGQLIRWSLKDFMRMDHEYGMSSPSFMYASKEWLLSLYPIGNQELMTRGWMYALLKNLTDNRFGFRVRFSLIGREGKAFVSSGAEWDGRKDFRSQKLVNRAELEFLGERALPNGTLYLVCQIETPKDYEKLDLGSKEAKSAEAAEASFQADGTAQIDCLSKSVRKLQYDLEEMLLYGRNSDVTLMLTGKYYKAHRAILSARSPAFMEMFERDAKNAASSTVLIESGNADSFSDFLHYIYTGSDSVATAENAMDLYALSILYRVDELKAVCLKRMLQSISNDSFCDLQTFAIRYDEAELTDALEQFFLLNSKDVVLTPKWEGFLNANTALGYELLMKARRLSNQ